MGYLLTILFTIISAYFDANQFKQEKFFVDHTPRFIFREIVVIIISYHTHTNILLNSSLFYLFFDYSLNIFWNTPWNYVGNTAKIDKIWRSIGGWKSQLIFKLTLVLIFTIMNLSPYLMFFN
jgi:hypothetical protein